MDQELDCINKGQEGCEGTFIFTQKEQEFYAGKGYTNPKRCGPCRIKKKADFNRREHKGYRKDNEY